MRFAALQTRLAAKLYRRIAKQCKISFFPLPPELVPERLEGTITQCPILKGAFPFFAA
jgi:hypothetical protein